MKAREAGRPVGTVAVAVAAVVVSAWPAAGDALVGGRSALAAGQAWRLWTAHLVHFSASHALWSGLVWLSAGAWLEREDRRGWVWLTLAGAPLVTAAALAGDGEMGRYGGLSGLACAPLVWVALRLWREKDGGKRAAGMGIFSLLILKVVAERWGGGTLLAHFGVEAGEVRPAIWAHVAGMAVGAVLAARRGGRGTIAEAG